MGQQNWNASLNRQERSVLPPDQIYNGHPQSPDIAAYFPGGGWQWIWTTPYYRAAPWPSVLVSEMERTATLEPCERHLLPVPQLDWDGHGTHLRTWQLQGRYHAAKNAIAEKAQAFRRVHPANAGRGYTEEESP